MKKTALSILIYSVIQIAPLAQPGRGQFEGKELAYMKIQTEGGVQDFMVL